ncbi:fibronectin type III domain-containing protein [Arsenicibacter rosenii]|uniref:Fibronectin type-III domain-containing protein n=1 Tax=Arsenicibacter rosenii TaxID=1750698 RepID=A0A1S2VLP6_9BACT|nr:hypothetical protein [Arsenicibacter rosenii]OIN59330.1 hypothetical protein BLX24_10130 [Arsenicibacter rosenii]
MKRALVVLLWGTLSGAVQAQKAPNPTKPPSLTAAPVTDTSNRFQVVLLTRSYGDSIVLRWAPNNALLFRAAVRGGGYVLTRRSLGPDRKLKTDFEQKMAPWTIDQWKQKAGPRDTLAGVCVQLLYGKNSVQRPGQPVTLDDLVQQKTQDDLRLMIGLTLADANARHAEGMGLRFTDRNVQKGEVYFYTLYPLADAKNYPTPIEKATIVNDGPGERPAMVPVMADPADRTIKLRWSRMATQERFSAYYIERSDDGGRTFKRLNRRPWMQSSVAQFATVFEYKDSVAQNYRPYQYRVIGITPFAELSQPSPVLTAQGIDQTPPRAASNVTVKHKGGTEVQLSWQYGKAAGDFAGFAVGRSNAPNGPFTPVTNALLPAGTTTFVDKNADPYDRAYYVVVAVDTVRNAASTPAIYCRFMDVNGPAKPKGLQGYIDSTGFVRVVWEPNTDRDVMGYTVLFANDPTHVFTPVTSGFLAVSTFDDRTTLKTLTRKLYYRVIAWDQKHNPSPLSDILTLTRPDKVPPAAPAIESFAASDSSVRILWRVSASDDVREQILLRRSEPTERWKELLKVPANQYEFSDTTVKSRTTYQYAIVAVDSAGLRSAESFPLQVRTPATYPRAAQQLQANLGPDQKSVVLNWKLTNDFARYVIYRGEAGQPLRTYAASNRSRTYTDKSMSKGWFEYAVKVIYPDGTESGLSNRVKIEIR